MVETRVFYLGDFTLTRINFFNSAYAWTIKLPAIYHSLCRPADPPQRIAAHTWQRSILTVSCISIQLYCKALYFFKSP
jgi:hypothetical protein